MVNSLNGISVADYQSYLKVQNAMAQVNATNPVNLSYQNDSVQFSSNRCTDGKDDGKIGLFSALGNATQGVVKTIGNGLKGMVTDKNGNFSLGKTLLSVGTAAVCIACPAVGVAACVVGGTMGAVQVGKGIYNAATATSDAEAKQAWENIGGGTFTVAASVVGAKAGVKAVKSTAGPNSALAQLDDAATLGQKATALGKDMVSSTKNQFNSIKSSATSYAQTAKAKIKDPNFTDGLKQTAKNGIDKAKNNTQNLLDSIKTKYKNTDIAAAKELLKEAQKSGNADEIALAKQFLKEATVNSAKNIWQTAKGKVTKENAQALLSGIKEACNKTVNKENITNIANTLKGNAKNIWTELSTGKHSYSEVVNKYGFENVAEVIKYMGGVVYGSAI